MKAIKYCESKFVPTVHTFAIFGKYTHLTLINWMYIL